MRLKKRQLTYLELLLSSPKASDRPGSRAVRQRYTGTTYMKLYDAEFQRTRLSQLIIYLPYSRSATLNNHYLNRLEVTEALREKHEDLWFQRDSLY
jgi:hypothetical protein